MAGPSIVVRVLGDLKGLSSQVDAAVGKSAGAAGKLRSAFSGALGAINQTGVLGPFADALAGVDTALGQLGEHGKTVGSVMMGVGGTMAGVGVALSALGSKEQASHNALKQSIENTGKSYDDYAGRIEHVIKKQENYGHSAHETQDALRVLTQATKDPAKALDLIGTASDLAAAKHEDLQTAATQLGRAYNGAGKIFKEFGVTAAPKAAAALKAVATATKAASTADDQAKNARQRLADVLEVWNSKSKHSVSETQHLRDAMQAVGDADAKAREAHSKLAAAQDAASKAAKGTSSNMAALAKAVHGQAAVAADTFSGRLKAMGARLEDAAAKFGERFGPALTVAGTAMAGLGGVVTATSGIIGVFSKGQETATAATEAITAAEGTEAAASWAALGPILLIIGAIAALVAIGYVIYRNWDTIWAAIKFAVKAVWDWIKKNWPLLLGILMGPIGLAVVLIVKNWNTIKNAIKAVWDWIRTAWGAVYHWFADPISAAASQIAGFMRSILNVIQGVWNWINGAWHAIYGWLTGPFSSAVGAIAGFMNSIWRAITAVYNWIWSNFSAVYGWITKPFNDAVSFVKGLWDSLWSKITGFVSNVTGAFSGVVDSVKGVFKGAINGIISVWNGLNFTMGGWTVGVGPLHYTFPQYTFGMPHIQPLATGGLVEREGLFYLHAGEAVTPAPATHSGPAVYIENLTVAETLDVDTFMRRAAWAVQRERI